ncbi:DUF3265 domain-containing protein [Vibrio parahaemolyticus]|nr:DUF3265 domain-containing protein [Vibrio parahaemolyticus]
MNITNCLRVIRNAWHFYYALRLVFKVVCGSIGVALICTIKTKRLSIPVVIHLLLI